MTIKYIDSEAIYLRPFEREDLACYRRWWNTPEVTRYMETGWCPSNERILEGFYQSICDVYKNVVFGVVENETDHLIGTCGLYEIFWPGRRAEFRIMIGEPSYLGKGYGTLATQATIKYGFQNLNLEVVHLGVNAKNSGAVKAYKKAGFVEEGIRRNYVYSRGEYCDAIMMSILRSEFSDHNS